MDLQWQHFYIYDVFIVTTVLQKWRIYSHTTTIQDICNSKNKNETNMNINFTIDYEKIQTATAFHSK